MSGVHLIVLSALAVLGCQPRTVAPSFAVRIECDSSSAFPALTLDNPGHLDVSSSAGFTSIDNSQFFFSGFDTSPSAGAARKELLKVLTRYEPIKERAIDLKLECAIQTSLECASADGAAYVLRSKQTQHVIEAPWAFSPGKYDLILERSPRSPQGEAK